jgi:hypothetical protein
VAVTSLALNAIQQNIRIGPMTDTIINVIRARHSLILAWLIPDEPNGFQSAHNDRATLLAILDEVSEEIKREPSSASIEIQAILERK